MTDLKELSAWHEAEGCRFAEFMAGDDSHELNRVKIHRETARILSVLERVRASATIVAARYGQNEDVLRLEFDSSDVMREFVEWIKGEKS